MRSVSTFLTAVFLVAVAAGCSAPDSSNDGDAASSVEAAVAEGRIEKTQPNVFSADETADVGKDEGTVVSPAFASVADSEFAGHVESVTVSIRE